MGLALEEARAAGTAGDVPVGAVIVSKGASSVEDAIAAKSDRDPTAHAEIVALREAARGIGQWRIEATLYVTQEPCPMCAGAIVNARVTRLVFGCTNPKAGAVTTLYQIITDPRLNHRVEVRGWSSSDRMCSRAVSVLCRAATRSQLSVGSFWRSVRVADGV